MTPMGPVSRAERQGRLVDELVLVGSSVIVTMLLFGLYLLVQSLPR
jgi:hypothetical protein